MSSPSPLRRWIEKLPESGRYCFTRSEAESAVDASRATVMTTLLRQKKRGLIASPRRGFWILVPPEYRAAGSPPASWFIDDLMKHLGRTYYVALLSAAALHDAGHQQPMAFQVIADRPERDIEVGRVRIEFHVSNLTADAATERLRTETGTMVVATPETTAFDLVRFPAASGHWSNIATVLAELSERLDADRLAAGADRVARSDVQRLGWMLDLVGEHDLADALARRLVGKRLAPTPLNTAQAVGEGELDGRWRIVVNDDVEPDL